jgi:hypothetical protein
MVNLLKQPIVLVLFVLANGMTLAEEPRMSPGDHWSFQPIAHAQPPQVKSDSWGRNALDRFILSRLEAKGLAPSPEADRATLIRRLKFDLVGLPPTPEEVDAFARDPDPLAYEKLVERYLANPHFGERWARHWLDVVRFAESDGFETNQARPNAWPYRDYVIRAFNNDKPYDRFVQEQLAGDQLGEDAATGFLVGGAVDRVKSPDPVLTAQQRADELHDMVSTTSSTFLGLTAGCARCHDHKFDPIPQADYYSLTAVFAGVQHAERAIHSPDEQLRKKEASKLREQIAAATAQLEELEPLANPKGPAGRASVNPRRNVERFAPLCVKYLRFTVLGTNNIEPCIDELELFTPGPAPRNVALASLGTKATSSGNYSASPQIHRLEFVNDGQYGNSHSWISNQVGAGWVQLELKEPAVVNRLVWARDREGRYADRLAVKYRIEVAIDAGKWQVVATSDDRLPAGSNEIPPALGKNERDEYQAINERRTTLQKRVAELERADLIYAGAFMPPGPTYRLNRGDPMQKREQVGPDALTRIGAHLRLNADASEAKRRLALAHWITDPRNPLTARVMVNRLWLYHFGTGIVDTPSDFGRNGSRPTHPELLDWLADQLISHGWSLKHIHRLIVLSATYRQAGEVRADGIATDAGTRLLWRFPPRRLEAEPLRDAILSVSGNLDERMGGPGFDLFDPNSNYVKVYNSKKQFGPAEWRRMVYQNKPRMQLDDTFGSFDCPDAGQIAPRRTSSTTALQALNLLNSRFLVQQSRIFADRLAREAGNHSSAQVRRAFRLAFQRQPDQDELSAAVQLVRQDGLTELCRALFNANEFVYVR